MVDSPSLFYREELGGKGSLCLMLVTFWFEGGRKKCSYTLLKVKAAKKNLLRYHFLQLSAVELRGSRPKVFKRRLFVCAVAVSDSHYRRVDASEKCNSCNLQYQEKLNSCVLKTHFW